MIKKLTDINTKILELENGLKDGYTELVLYIQVAEYWLDSIFNLCDFDSYTEITSCKDKIAYKDYDKILKELDYLDHYVSDTPVLRYRTYKALMKLPETREFWTRKCFLEYLSIDNQKEQDINGLSDRLYTDQEEIYNLVLDLETLYENLEKWDSKQPI